MTPLRFLAAGHADPHVVRRLGRARLARFFYRHSRGAWGDRHAEKVLAAAAATLRLWEDEVSFPDLADDIAIEARLALTITAEIKDLDQRIALLLAEADPNGIITSAPGVGPITGAAILGRLGEPDRFRSLAAVRAYSGLVPSLDASGVSGRHGGPTKRGDALLREALFMAAEQARRQDPTLAAKYHRLMTEQGKHHNSAICHVATALLTRVAACWRDGTRYQLRDLEGAAVSPQQARQIIADRYTVSDATREARRTVNTKTSRTKQEVAKRSIDRPASTTTLDADRSLDIA